MEFDISGEGFRYSIIGEEHQMISAPATQIIQFALIMAISFVFQMGFLELRHPNKSKDSSTDTLVCVLNSFAIALFAGLTWL